MLSGMAHCQCCHSPTSGYSGLDRRSHGLSNLPALVPSYNSYRVPWVAMISIRRQDVIVQQTTMKMVEKVSLHCSSWVLRPILVGNGSVDWLHVIAYKTHHLDLQAERQSWPVHQPANQRDDQVMHLRHIIIRYLTHMADVPSWTIQHQTIVCGGAWLPTGQVVTCMHYKQISSQN